MSRNGSTKLWAKKISLARDRLQSRILVWVALPALCYLTISATRLMSTNGGRFIVPPGRYDEGGMMAIAISVLFALASWRTKAATPMAAVTGGMICVTITRFSMALPGLLVVRSGLTPLILVVVLTFGTTRLGQRKEAIVGSAENQEGRDAAQVVANLGIAALFSSIWGYHLLNQFCGYLGEWAVEHAGHDFALIHVPMLAALAEAAADTVSSEIGHAYGGTPFLLTTFRRVPRGTDGAISLYGTLAGIAAAAIIAVVGAPAMGMSPAECLVAFAAGVCGLFFDSLLGATVERRGWLGNNLVNFISTAFAAGVSLVAIRSGAGWIEIRSAITLVL